MAWYIPILILVMVAGFVVLFWVVFTWGYGCGIKEAEEHMKRLFL